MRMFWTMFFLGSMLLVGADVTTRRQAVAEGRQDRRQEPAQAPMADDNDPLGFPTPRP